jgi:hypothetical protein
MSYEQKLSTSDLHYQKIGRSFFAEISEIPNFVARQTFALVSHATGNEISMELIAEKRDADNDVIAWEYVPVNDDRITKVVILND